MRIDYMSLAQVSSTKSEIVMQDLEKTLLEKGIDLSNTFQLFGWYKLYVRLV